MVEAVESGKAHPWERLLLLARAEHDGGSGTPEWALLVAQLASPEALAGEMPEGEQGAVADLLLSAGQLVDACDGCGFSNGVTTSAGDEGAILAAGALESTRAAIARLLHLPVDSHPIRAVVDEVRSLCRDYSSRNGSVYIKDVEGALDAIEQQGMADYAGWLLQPAGSKAESPAAVSRSFTPVGHVDMQNGPGDRVKWSDMAVRHGTPLYAQSACLAAQTRVSADAGGLAAQN